MFIEIIPHLSNCSCYLVRICTLRQNTHHTQNLMDLQQDFCSNFQQSYKIVHRYLVVLFLLHYSCFKCCLVGWFMWLFFSILCHFFGQNSSAIVFIIVCESQRIVWIAEFFKQQISVKNIVATFSSKHSGSFYSFSCVVKCAVHTKRLLLLGLAFTFKTI